MTVSQTTYRVWGSRVRTRRPSDGGCDVTGPLVPVVIIPRCRPSSPPPISGRYSWWGTGTVVWHILFITSFWPWLRLPTFTVGLCRKSTKRVHIVDMGPTWSSGISYGSRIAPMYESLIFDIYHILSSAPIFDRLFVICVHLCYYTEISAVQYARLPSDQFRE